MKNLFKGIGIAICYLAIYFTVNFAVIFIGGLVYGIIAVVEAVQTSRLVEYLTDNIIRRVAENTVLLMLIANVLCILIYWLILMIRKKPVREHLALNRVPFSILWPVFPLGMALNVLISHLIDLLPIPSGIIREYIEATGFLTGRTTIIMVIYVAIAAPLLEEILFRGLIMKALRRGMSAGSALIIQSAVFALMHGQILWMSYALILGIVLGLLKLRYNSLYAAVFMHFSFNASNFILSPLYKATESSGLLSIVTICLALILTVILSIAIYKNTATVSQPGLKGFPDNPEQSQDESNMMSSRGSAGL